MPGRVEHDRDAVGLLVAEHLHQHRREAVDRVGDRALGRRQVGRQRVEGAVREREAVEQEERRHRSAIVRLPTVGRRGSVATVVGVSRAQGVSSPSTTRRAISSIFTRFAIACCCRKRQASCSASAVVVHEHALGPVDDLAGLEPRRRSLDLALERGELGEAAERHLDRRDQVALLERLHDVRRARRRRGPARPARAARTR